MRREDFFDGWNVKIFLRENFLCGIEREKDAKMSNRQTLNVINSNRQTFVFIGNVQVLKICYDMIFILN